jgi:hypothetical protein
VSATAEEIRAAVHRGEGSTWDHQRAIVEILERDAGSIRRLLHPLGVPGYPWSGPIGYALRPLGLRRVAGSIDRRRLEEARSRGERPDRGLAGMGMQQRALVRWEIESHNALIGIARARLGPLDRHTLRATDKAHIREEVAEKVIRAWQSEGRLLRDM